MKKLPVGKTNRTSAGKAVPVPAAKVMIPVAASYSAELRLVPVPPAASNPNWSRVLTTSAIGCA